MIMGSRLWNDWETKAFDQCTMDGERQGNVEGSMVEHPGEVQAGEHGGQVEDQRGDQIVGKGK